MRKIKISKNQINKLIAISLMLLIVVTPISVYAQVENLGESITVNVAGYEPTVIKSSQIESTDIPVYVYLNLSTIGSLLGMNVETEPFISSPNIKSITVYPSSDTSGQYLKGSPLYIPPTNGRPTLAQPGYLIVNLKQIPDESKVPNNITLNMTMKIYFDFNRGYGDVSTLDMVLKEYGKEEDWKKNPLENSFWNKKGYLRLVSINNNEARIEVLDSSFSPISALFGLTQGTTSTQNFQEAGIITLSTGQIKTFTLPGSTPLFHDQVRIQLNKISDPQTEAKIKVISNDGIFYYTLVGGMKLGPGSEWIVESVGSTKNSDGTLLGTVVIKNYVGDRRTLILTQKPKTGIQQITDENLNDNKLKVCPVDSIISSEDATKQIDDIKINYNSDKEGARKLLCTAISEYEQSVNDNVAVADEAYLKMGDAYNSLSAYLVNDQDSGEISKLLALYYLTKVSNAAKVENQLTNLQNELLKGAITNNEYLADESKTVSLVDVIEPDKLEQSSAQILINEKYTNINGEPINYLVNDPILTLPQLKDKNGVLRNYVWKINSIQSNSLVIQKYEDNNSIQSNTLVLGEEKEIDGTKFKLLNIASKKRAYITILPGTGDSYSQSSFKIHIPIEKRSIRPWTNAEIDRMINDTNKQIEILSKYIEQLDNLIRPWKYVCFATFALLTVKNSFLAGADRNRARADIMPYYDKICENAVLAGKYLTYDKCMADKAQEIGNTLDLAEVEQKAVIDCSNKGETCYSNLDIYPETLKDSQYQTKLKELNIQDPIDSSLWDEYYKCQKYQNLKNKNLPADFLASIDENCAQVKENIVSQKDAFDIAVQQSKINTADLSTKEGKQVVATNFRATYNAAREYNVRKPSQAEIGDVITKAKAQNNIVLDPKNVVVQANSVLGMTNNFNLIQITGGSETTKPTFSTFTNALPVTNADLNPQLKAQCTTNQNLPDCKTLNQEIEINSNNNNYKIFKSQDGKQYYAALSTIEFSDVGERTTYASTVKAEFDNNKKPYCLPTGNGNFVKILDWYATGDPKSCEYWNVGPDGLLCSGDDRLIYGTDQINNHRETSGLCTNIVKSTGTCAEGNSIKIRGVNYDCSQKGYQISQLNQQGHCQDVMDPEDCKRLFAVCDPVMCPASRFNLGGKWPIASGSVVSTGIIGSLVLGLPNFPETPVPVCLPGILAGLRSIKSLLDGFVSCLEAAKINHENIGICDQIRSVGICELLWRELINIFQARGSLTDVISERLFNNQQGSGGEYLKSFNENIDAVSNSVNYFTSDYASSAFAAYKGRSTEEIGTQICQAAIYGKMSDVGDMVDQLAEPENPPQFMATFDESPWAVKAGQTFSTAAGTQSAEQSIYSVYFHIYAGNVPELARTGSAAEGIRFAVYLRDNLGRILPVTSKQEGQLWDTVTYGDYKDVSVERIGPLGMTQICVVINGKENCGFGKVTTAYAVNALNDYLVKDEALKQNINSQDQCVSDVPTTSPSLGGVILPSQYGALTTGVVRTCSIKNPGDSKGETDYWRQIGSCGSDKSGNNLGLCWIDTRTTSVNNVMLNEEIQKNIIISSNALQGAEAIDRALLLNKDIALSYLNDLNAAKEDIGKSNTPEGVRDKSIKLISDGINRDNKIITYDSIIKYSIDPVPRALARIEKASIYVLLANTVAKPTPTPLITVVKQIQSKLDNGYACTKNDDCNSGYCNLDTLSCDVKTTPTTKPVTTPTTTIQVTNKTIITTNCETCGYFCSETNCKSLGNCRYVKGTIWGDCYTCPTDCGKIPNQALCSGCDKCQWSNNKCVQKTIGTTLNIATSITGNSCFPIAQDSFSRISFNFGNQRDAKYGDRCHAAVDIYTKSPSKVLAISNGVVKKIAYFDSCNNGIVNYILIDHGTYTINYGEINRGTEKVKVGDQVIAGQLIGVASNCGMLHLEEYNQPITNNLVWYPYNKQFSSENCAKTKPQSLVDPTELIKSLQNNMC
ncbi:MAG: M23 family metallopeptidase [Candidatus Nanoarchaeia archaeon]|nr:M23 family metallopeptidase [Candidatus Nanoarchaeia archaeon]